LRQKLVAQVLASTRSDMVARFRNAMNVILAEERARLFHSNQGHAIHSRSQHDFSRKTKRAFVATERSLPGIR
jgi:hypothetical protein